MIFERFGVPLLDEFETGQWPSFVNPGPIMKTNAPEDHDQADINNKVEEGEGV